MSSNELREAVSILAEIAQTGMCCLDARQQQLLRDYAQLMANK